jgi:hypothetical protein
MSKGKKVLLGIVIFLVGWFALGELVNYFVSDEEKEQLATEREDKDFQNMYLNIRVKTDLENP